MMAFNPFKAIGNAIKGAVDAVRGAFGGKQPPAPAKQPPAPAKQPPAPRMPKFTGKAKTESYTEKDRQSFGIDSSFERDLNEAIADFISERGGTSGLSGDAREWLSHSSITQIFDKYWTSGGFTGNQVLDGMVNITNITITENPDGTLDVEFDYDSEVDSGEYVVSGHCSGSA